MRDLEPRISTDRRLDLSCGSVDPVVTGLSQRKLSEHTWPYSAATAAHCELALHTLKSALCPFSVHVRFG